MIEEIESLHAEYIEVEYVIKDGKPNKVVCEEARKAQADLIIIVVSDTNIISNLFLKELHPL